MSVSHFKSSSPAVPQSNSAITTVGYGEITPRSFLGRLITIPILVCGLVLITLPSFVLGREFSHVWERMISKKASFSVLDRIFLKSKCSISKMWVKTTRGTNPTCLPIQTQWVFCLPPPQSRSTRLRRIRE